MGFVNKIMLMGNMTRDPELRQLPSGSAVCDFGMATNRVFKTAGGEERQETVFVDCTAFGRTAEVIAEYCPKGRALFVEGRLHYETWEDKEGNRRSKLSVIVEQFQFVGSRGGGGAAEGEESQAGHAQRELPLSVEGNAAGIETGEERGRPAEGERRRGQRGAVSPSRAGRGPQSAGVKQKGPTVGHRSESAAGARSAGSVEMNDKDLSF